MGIQIEVVNEATAEFTELIGELDAELNIEYSPDCRHGLRLADLFRPDISMFIALVDGMPAGCGGIQFTEELAELKRMYVRPTYRGQSVGNFLLDHLAREALAKRIERLALETGDAQRRAINFYQRNGFTQCPAFGNYALMPAENIRRSVFLERWLPTFSRQDLRS